MIYDRGDHRVLGDLGWRRAKGYLTPKGITASTQIMTILHRGFSFAADDLSSSLGSGADPMAAIRSYIWPQAVNKLAPPR